jgi:hypothetical protein
VKEKDESKSNVSLQHRLKVERSIQAAVNVCQCQSPGKLAYYVLLRTVVL